MSVQDTQKPTSRPADLPKPAHPPGHQMLAQRGECAMHEHDTDDTCSETPGSDPTKKHMAKMRAKANRLCCRTSTGKLKVSQDIHEMWMKAGKVRDDMVELMADADGDKDSMKLCTCMSSTNVLIRTLYHIYQHT